MSTEEVPLRQILDRIAARASTPPERQHLCDPIASETSESQQQAQKQVQHLYTLLGSNDDEARQRFLACYDLDQQQISTFLASPVSGKLGFRPGWIEVLEQVVTTCTDPPFQQQKASSLDRALFPEDPVPFEEILLPFLRYARLQCFQCPSVRSASLVSEPVLATMEHWLLQRLAWAAEDVFQLEFSLFRAQHALWSFSPERRELYHAFVARCQGEELLSLFQEYSVLARLLIMLMEQWIEICTEFMQRFTEDLETITQQFHDGSPLGPVIQLQVGCSDPHHHGRSVFLVPFAAGLKVVYKPRSLEVDRAFFDLLT